MSDQGNEKPNVELQTDDDVEGHVRPKWHAIDDEPAEGEGADDVEGHVGPSGTPSRKSPPPRAPTTTTSRATSAQVALIVRQSRSVRDSTP